jgi:hypothetical protein
MAAVTFGFDLQNLVVDPPAPGCRGAVPGLGLVATMNVEAWTGVSRLQAVQFWLDPGPPRSRRPLTALGCEMTLATLKDELQHE